MECQVYPAELPKKHDFFLIGAKYLHSMFTDVYMRVNAIDRTSPTTVKLNLSFYSRKAHHKTMNDCWIEVDEDMCGNWGRYGDS